MVNPEVYKEYTDFINQKQYWLDHKDEYLKSLKGTQLEDISDSMYKMLESSIVTLKMSRFWICELPEHSAELIEKVFNRNIK